MNNESKNKSVVPYKTGRVIDSPFGLFHDEFDSFFERALNFAWADPFWVNKRNYRIYDVKENEKSYTIEVELPRFKREQIKLETLNGVVQLTAQNEKNTYTKSWALSNANLDKVSSKLEDGVLTITIEKTPESQPKLIEIK